MKAVIQVFSFDVVGKIISGATSILLIRFMSESEYARYLLALSIVAVATGTLASSFNRIYLVGYERLKLGQITSSFLGLQLTVIGILALVGLPLMRDYREIYWVIVALVISTCLSEYARTVFQQQLAFLRYSLVETARTLLFIAGLLLFIVQAPEMITAWQVLLLQTGALFVVFILMFGRHVDWINLFRLRNTLELILSVVQGQYRYLFGYFFVLAFFSQVDVFMLQIMATPSQLASYGSAFRYYTIIVLILNSLHTVLLPLVQRLQSIEDLDRLYGIHMRLLLLIIPALLFAGFISQWIIPIIDQGKYPDAIPIFRILCLSAIISIAFSPHVNLIMRFEDFRFLLLLILGGLLVNVGLNLVLIPLWAAIGTSLATLVAFGFVTASIYLRAREYRKQFRLSVESHV